ncbi:MAG: glycosyltransferase [Chitinophagaceae bacterium]
MNPELGGPSQGIRNSIPQLEALGVHNEVLSLDDPASPFLAKEVFTINAIGAGRGPWRYNAGFEPWLEKNIERFDVIIIHGLWLYTSHATAKVIRNLKKKQGQRKIPRVYVMPHGMLDPYFQKAEGRKIKAARNWLYWKLIERRVVNEADGLIFTCEEELRLARTTFSGYRPKKEINVGYGTTDPPVYNDKMKTAFAETVGKPFEGPYLLFLSRIHSKKGVDILIEAYREIKKQQIGVPRLVIAGPGLDTDYGKRIRALAGNDDDIVFTGMLRGDAKFGALYGCEAFILPSHQENFGIAIAEALACHKPAMISNKVNIWREIKEAGAGLIEEDTKEGVQKLLRGWLELSSTQKTKMTENAGNVFRQQFSTEQFAIRLKELFTS